MKALFNKALSMGAIAALAACGAESVTYDGVEGPQWDTQEHVTQAQPDAAELAARRAERDADERAQGRVYSIVVEDGHTVNFAETQTGSLVLYERFQQGQASVLSGLRAATPADFFEALRPGEEVPAELVELGERFTFETVDETAEPAPVHIEKHAIRTGGHFEDDHKLCPRQLVSTNLGGQVDVNPHCFLNVTGNWTTPTTFATHSVAYVGAYRGDVKLMSIRNGVREMVLTAETGETLGIAQASGFSGGRRITQNLQYRTVAGSGGFHLGIAWTTQFGRGTGWYWGKGAQTTE